MMEVITILSLAFYLQIVWGIFRLAEQLWKKKLKREGIDWDDEFNKD